MSSEKLSGNPIEMGTSFFDRPDVKLETIPVGEGIPLGLESVFDSRSGIGGAYGSWGKSFNNEDLINLIENWLDKSVQKEEKMNLTDLGFTSRHHIPLLSDADHLKLELEVGARILKEAIKSNGWNPSDIEGVLLGISGPVADDYVCQISRQAGIPESALKVSVHKACDGSMGALNLSLNPQLVSPGQINIAQELFGKKILVGGIEGLSRFICKTQDRNALQLFGNGAGVIGIIPGESIKFLVGKDYESYDEDGVLTVRMFYPHSGERNPGKSMIEISKDINSGMRVAGLMHEPIDNSPIAMSGMMGMVKLFVRTGVQVVSDVYNSYQALMHKVGTPEKSLTVAIAHHANFKINSLKHKHLQKIGINFPMPWLLSDFGNVCAASNMIAFLRQIPLLKPGDHVLFDGFGAGTYYDVMAVEIGG